MFDKTLKKFWNCYLLKGDQIVKEDLWVRAGRVVDAASLFFEEETAPGEDLDCGGHLIAPGFIDLQINGGFGVDFSHDLKGPCPDCLDDIDDHGHKAHVEQRLARVARGLLAHGVTAFCPTVISSFPECYRSILESVEPRPGSGELGAAVLGLHLEGPFINPERKGAHPLEAIQRFGSSSHDRWVGDVERVYGPGINSGNVRIVTLAPELLDDVVSDGEEDESRSRRPDLLSSSPNVLDKFRRTGIAVSLGHSAATLKQAEAAVRDGASMITHLFNAMNIFHHRDPGLVGLVTTDPGPDGVPPEGGSGGGPRTVYFGIIPDGVHTHPAAVKLAYKANFRGLCLVTDAIGALGLEEGSYSLGTQTVQVKGNRAMVVGTSTLAGAIGTFWDGVCHFREWAGCSWVEALQAGSLHPARVLGLEGRKGTLECGADADFVIINTECQKLISTWISGHCVYRDPCQVH